MTNLFHELKTATGSMEAFESIVQAQRPATMAWVPVTDYSEEARMALERPHAQRLLETFRPRIAPTGWTLSAFDVGCGFNYLARAVNEIAGHTVMIGADKDNPQADHGIDITMPHLPLRGMKADLIVCREVLEHLTLREIRTAITNLCYLARSFVYITTRYSSEHDILRVETSDNLDPTHITLAAKDFYRLLLTLEGFKARPDLEAKMDHLNKGRVLVYERA